MKNKHAITAALLTVAIGLPQFVASAQVLRYTFDEASGDALDSGSAPASNGVLTSGAARSTDTPSGTGSSLDLRTDSPIAYTLAADSDDLDGLAALTLTTWLKVETYPTNLSNNKRLVAKQAASTFGGFNFSMNATPNDGVVGADNFKIGLFLGNNVSAGGTDFGFVFADVDVDAANKWVMLAVTYDSALADANTKFYIGGVSTPVAQLGIDQTIFQMTVDAGGALMGVGYTDAAATSDTSVTGWQDDVRVYNTVLDLAALDAVRLENLGGGPVLAADFNNDTKVDDADFDAWTNGYGLATGATKPQGNADADMDVDGADFLIWQSEAGSGVTPPAAAIPEPTSQLLAVLLSAAAIAGRRSAFAQGRLSAAHVENLLDQPCD